MYTGLILNVISNLAFVFSSYVVHYFLGNTMSPGQYGVMGTIITVLDFEYLFLNNGIRQTLSGEISGERYDAFDLIKKSLAVQFLMVGVITIVNVAGAEGIARLLSDETLEKYIRYAAIIVPANGLYVITLGINEGLQQFKSSAMAGIVYACSKLSVIVYVLWIADDAIIGTELGFLTALIIATLVSASMILKGKKKFVRKKGHYIQIRKYVKQILNFSVFFVVVSVIMSIDTLIVKGLITDDAMAGFYTGAVNFAKVSYFIMSAFVTLIIPIVSRRYLEEGGEKVGEILKTFFRIILCFVLPITVIISATSPALLKTFYNEEYIVAAPALSMLALAHLFTGVMAMLNMVISTVEKKNFSTWLAVGIVLADIPLCIILTKEYGIAGTAFGGLCCTLTGMILSYIHTRKILGGMLSGQSALILGINIVLCIMLRVVSEMLEIKNIFQVALLYAGVYAGVILLLIAFRICDVRILIKMIKGKKA